MTLSALASTPGGIGRPICLAVFKLTTSSNLPAVRPVVQPVCAFQDFVDVNRRAARKITAITAIGDKPAGFRVFRYGINSRQPMFQGEIDYFFVISTDF